MEQLHPTSSAGDGKVIEQSHYIKKSDKLDNIIECAQCGWNVNLTNRPTGDSLGAIGNPTFTTKTINPPAPGVSQSDTYGDPVDPNSGGFGLSFFEWCVTTALAVLTVIGGMISRVFLGLQKRLSEVEKEMSAKGEVKPLFAFIIAKKK